MPLRRLLGVILLVLGTSVGMVGPAVARTYATQLGAASVSSNHVVQGHSVRISGEGFCAGSPVRLTVTNSGKTVIKKTINANAAGVVSTSVVLSGVGRNNVVLRGCFVAGEQNQELSALVVVVAHSGTAHPNDDKVNKGDRVRVRASGFCRNARVLVRVYDDGVRYQWKYIEAGRDGKAETSVTLTRAGSTTITLQGCWKKGGTILKTTTVKVRSARSFRSSPTAYAGDIAGNVSPGGYAVAGGGLLLVLFGATQVMFVRRRRHS